jgi:hypothetical protein
MAEVSPTARRNRHRFDLLEGRLAGATVLAAGAGYMLHVPTLEFLSVLGAVASFAFVVARGLLATD